MLILVVDTKNSICLNENNIDTADYWLDNEGVPNLNINGMAGRSYKGREAHALYCMLDETCTLKGHIDNYSTIRNDKE